MNVLSLAVVGSGGAGVVTAGKLLLDAVANHGAYGLMRRSSGPQIRGGESAALLRFADRPVENTDDRYDVLVAVDWHNVDRFVDEIPLDSSSIVIHDQAQEVPVVIAAAHPQMIALPLTETARRIEFGRSTMVAVGFLCALTGLPAQAAKNALATALGAKGGAVIRGACDCIDAGAELETDWSGCKPIPRTKGDEVVRWQLSGNEACGLGALRGGVRFVAAYPITPASEVLEWLAPRLERVGGGLLQAEDELASVNMIIGAAYGGVPALTATSGPGLALMLESIGLAVTSETPIVVLDVMRAGPSTGIPTKSEQSDLNIALYGVHGDAPHLVLAPNSIADCVLTTQWAVHLAEALQTAAIVLSDQSLGQSRAVVDRPADVSFMSGRRLATADQRAYRRYAVTADGISPMALPGTRGMAYTADGLEHDEFGTPSTRSGDHAVQLDKRWRKVRDFDYGRRWGDVLGDGRTAILCWGSTTGAVIEAVERAHANQIAVRAISIRLLAPLPIDQLQAALTGVTRLLIVEQSHSGQFYHYLRSQIDLPEGTERLARPGPLAIAPGELVDWISAQETA